jgi:hypothetical protein
MPQPIELMRSATPQRETAPALPARLLESLERSKAQAEAGETVPAAPILDELRASISRMKDKRATQDRT